MIVGWTPGKGARESTLGSLLLALYDDRDRLRYVGNVGTGFTQPVLATLVDELRAHETARRPVDPAPAIRGVHWVRPELVCEVEYQSWTDDGRLRAASFKGLRPDKLPRDCRRERAFDEPDQPAGR